MTRTANVFNRKQGGRLMIGFLALSLFICSSCDDPNQKKNSPKVFFDLKGFIESQVLLLNKIQPTVSKRMGIGKESSQISIKDVDWKKELELFAQADINKPALRQSYIIERPDSVTYVYSLKPGQDLPVKFLRIKLNKAHGLPVRIDAALKSENKLYTSQKNISLSLGVNEDVAIIISYNITGFQKLAIMEKKPFLIAAVVKY